MISPPPSPTKLPPPSLFTVTTSFTLGGTVDDYGTAAEESIKIVIANEAGASPSDVLIRITAGSVVVAAEIFVADQTAATSTANSLAAGALKDASSLETALKMQFDADGVNTTTLTVEAITAGPSAQVAGGSIEDAINAAAGLRRRGAPRRYHSRPHHLNLLFDPPHLLLLLQEQEGGEERCPRAPRWRDHDEHEDRRRARLEGRFGCRWLGAGGGRGGLHSCVNGRCTLETGTGAGRCCGFHADHFGGIRGSLALLVSCNSPN